MPLDPRLQPFVDQMPEANWETLTPQQLRQAYPSMNAVDARPEPVTRVENRSVPRPAGDSSYTRRESRAP